MTAAYLNKALKGVDITLVEAPHIKSIGVGEATFSTIKLFFDFLGLEEHEWMPSCNAAYKLAIKFVNWRKEGGHFFHPFQRYEMVDGYNIAEWWLKLKRGEQPFDYSCFTIPALCDAKRSPRYLDGRVFDDKVQSYFADGDRVPNAFLTEHQVQYPYAYHFDAGLLANFLEERSTKRGVRKVEDEVIHVALKEDGGISHIVTKEHGTIAGDLFVDCTGFRGLLINQTLKEPFISFSDTLLNDSAVALQVPVDIRSRGMEPFTTATALSAGWVWNIPLYGRIGTGYVYSSQFVSKEEAEAEFRQYLGPMADSCRANHIKMRIGRNRRSWVKNCVAIGLSSGFVEPLESTGIFFIQQGIEELVHHFPAGEIDESVIGSYNRTVAEAIDGVRDFLTLHYCVTDRDDTPYWQSVRNDVKVPASLEDRLSLWRRRLPNNKSINPAYHGFESYSYSVMLLGLGHEPETSLPVLDFMDDRNALEMFRTIRERAQYLVSTLPSQYEYLTHVRQRASQPGVPAAPAPYLYDDAGQLWKELVALNQPAA
jgi:tryptophan halogenase